LGTEFIGTSFRNLEPSFWENWGYGAPKDLFQQKGGNGRFRKAKIFTEVGYILLGEGRLLREQIGVMVLLENYYIPKGA